MQNELLEKIGKHIQKLRKEAGYKTQESFAKELNISKSSVGNYESGQNLPSYKYWLQMIKLLKCNTIEELFEPLFIHVSKNSELESLLNRIKRVYKIPKANKELYHQLDIIERLYNISSSES